MATANDAGREEKIIGILKNFLCALCGGTWIELQSQRSVMNVTLNGEKREVPDGLTVAGLLEFLNIQHQRVAVELNENIVKKDRYFEAVISEGDSLEVVSFMGGGLR